jgi:hypothetical protein
LAEKLQKLMDDGDVKPLKEGFFTDLYLSGWSKSFLSPSSPNPFEDTGVKASKVSTG